MGLSIDESNMLTICSIDKNNFTNLNICHEYLINWFKDADENEHVYELSLQLNYALNQSKDIIVEYYNLV